jgi:hypothetical protein
LVTVDPADQPQVTSLTSIVFEAAISFFCAADIRARGFVTPATRLRHAGRASGRYSYSRWNNAVRILSQPDCRYMTAKMP